MKKIFLLFIAFFAFSCSDDDSDANNTNGSVVLITKLTQVIYDGATSETYVTNFDYDGSKLTSYSTGSTSVTFEYDGEKVLNQKRYTNGVLSRTQTFNYEGNKLTSILSDDLTRSIFTYTGDKLTSVQNQYLDEDVWETNHIVTYEYDGGNISEKNEILTAPFASDFRVEYQYDNQPNPARDMNEYLRKIFIFEGILPISQNNISNMTSFSPASSSTGDLSTFDTTYDEVTEFPVLIKKMRNGSVITETEIEYSVTSN